MSHSLLKLSSLASSPLEMCGFVCPGVRTEALLRFGCGTRFEVVVRASDAPLVDRLRFAVPAGVVFVGVAESSSLTLVFDAAGEYLEVPVVSLRCVWDPVSASALRGWIAPASAFVP